MFQVCALLIQTVKVLIVKQIVALVNFYLLIKFQNIVKIFKKKIYVFYIKANNAPGVCDSNVDCTSGLCQGRLCKREF